MIYLYCNIRHSIYIKAIKFYKKGKKGIKCKKKNRSHISYMYNYRNYI